LSPTSHIGNRIMKNIRTLESIDMSIEHVSEQITKAYQPELLKALVDILGNLVDLRKRATEVDNTLPWIPPNRNIDVPEPWNSGPMWTACSDTNHTPPIS
jgi:hypothetical protein